MMKPSTLWYFISLLFLSLSFDICVSISISRSSFSKDFIFGAGSSSYQTEGAFNADGKGQSIWDYQTHKYPSIITKDGSNGDVAADFYHRYKEDIKLMKDMGLDSFRFSISWTRILPNGTKAGGVNQLGIDFYNNLINELLANGIEPYLSLFHLDVPQALEEKYGGFLSPNIVGDFEEYADICFKEFGDRVKYWVTVNEPNTFADMGYASGLTVPHRCTRTQYSYPCSVGDSAIEPYLVGHHFLLAHAAAFNLYKRKYLDDHKGKIGITISCNWPEPYDDSQSSKDAAERYYQHHCGWMFNPVTFGEYPESMRMLVGSRLPNFTKEQSEALKKSFDFLSVNYYTGSYVVEQQPTMPNFDQDAYSGTVWDKNSQPIGKRTPMFWLYDYPKGLENLLMHMKESYENPIIFIAENGYAAVDEPNSSHSIDEYLRDTPRIEYLEGHLSHLLRAIQRGANVKGYFAWSLLDNFEWDSGYLVKFGFYYIDRNNNLTRIMKDSGYWYKNVLSSEKTQPSTYVL